MNDIKFFSDTSSDLAATWVPLVDDNIIISEQFDEFLIFFTDKSYGLTGEKGEILILKRITMASDTTLKLGLLSFCLESYWVR